MKSLLLDEERYTRSELSTIIASDNKSYKSSTERVLCRLFTFSTAQTGGDLWLLPWCIDKLKQNVRDKKAYRFWIKYLEFKTRPMDVRKAFEKMMLHKNSKKDMLSKLKYMHLVKVDR